MACLAARLPSKEPLSGFFIHWNNQQYILHSHQAPATCLTNPKNPFLSLTFEGLVNLNTIKIQWRQTEAPKSRKKPKKLEPEHKTTDELTHICVKISATTTSCCWTRLAVRDWRATAFQLWRLLLLFLFKYVTSLIMNNKNGKFICLWQFRLINFRPTSTSWVLPAKQSSCYTNINKSTNIPSRIRMLTTITAIKNIHMYMRLDLAMAQFSDTLCPETDVERETHGF